MPTVELHGYVPAETKVLLPVIVDRMKELAFAAEIVVVHNSDRVEDLNGRARPFIRVLTRSVERASALVQRIRPAADVEVVLINFFERDGS